jgi:peptide-methionine (S)-S-oxide reductase
MIRSLPLLLILLAACNPQRTSQAPSLEAPPAIPTAISEDSSVARAIFAGGCFWCMEPPFDAVRGVLATTSGFTGGPERNPTYEAVSAGRTGHIEAVEVEYNPALVTYEELLDIFWVNVDPLDGAGQFCDRGAHYRSALFPLSAEQRRSAEASLRRVRERLARPIATEILEPTAFYAADEYHQDFYRKNPDHYRRYRQGCGRDARLQQVWGSEAGRRLIR